MCFFGNRQCQEVSSDECTTNIHRHRATHTHTHTHKAHCCFGWSNSTKRNIIHFINCYWIEIGSVLAFVYSPHLVDCVFRNTGFKQTGLAHIVHIDNGPTRLSIYDIFCCFSLHFVHVTAFSYILHVVCLCQLNVFFFIALLAHIDVYSYVY